MPPAQNYLARYNGHQLPGYVQSESNGSVSTLSSNQVAYSDASLSEYLSLDNKNLSLALRLWECDYETARREAQRAATLLRTNREDFVPLYIQFTDRHYQAMTKKVQTDKAVGTSTKIRDYVVDFEIKPWLYGETEFTISGGAGTFTTDSVGRTINDGGWTPTTLIISGTDVTVSGYTDSSDFAGFLSIPGSVSNLIIDSELLTATMAGVNVLDRIAWADFSIYVGPGRTTFDISGATSCSIKYTNRWLI